MLQLGPPATAGPPPGCRRARSARWRIDRAELRLERQRPAQYPGGDVDIGEVRAHRREVELRPPGGRIGLDPADRHRQPPARPASAGARADRRRRTTSSPIRR